NALERLLIQILEGGEDRQTADEFRNETELEQVLGLDLAEDLAGPTVVGGLDRGAEADGGTLAAGGNDPLKAGEGAAADEQDVGRVHLQEFLLRMLAPALGRHGGHRALHDLEKRLLHALARHIPGYGRIVGL